MIAPPRPASSRAIRYLITAFWLVTIAACKNEGCARDELPSPTEASAIAPSIDSGEGSQPSGGPSPLHRAWQEAKTDHARFLALASNRDGYRHDVEVRYPRIFENLDIYRRIPLGFDPAEIQSTLADHARSVSLEQRSFSYREKPTSLPNDRVIPEHLGPDEPFRWLEDEIRREVEIEILLFPADLGKLERWFETRGRAGPIFVVHSLDPAAQGGARVELSVYYFVTEVEVPKRRAPPFESDLLLEATGVDPGSTDDPKLTEIREMLDELESRREEIDESLAWRSRADLLDVRNRFFTFVSRQVEEQSWIRLVR